jgi:hypothetical protein
MGRLTEEQVRDTMAALTALVGDPWTAAVDRDWYGGGRTFFEMGVNPLAPEGLRIVVDVVNGRADVSGWPPEAFRAFESSYSNDKRPGHITVAIARGGAALGKEIATRYLPGWQAYLAVLRERKAGNDAWHAGVDELRARCQEALGPDIPLEPGQDVPACSFRRVPGLPHVYGELYLSTGSTLTPAHVDLTLHGLPVDLAQTILCTVATAGAITEHMDPVQIAPNKGGIPQAS